MNGGHIRRSDIVTERTKACACPNCGLELSGATGWQGRKPQPGNMCVCIRCGHLMIFNEDMTVRGPTDEEAVEIAGNRSMLLGQHVADHLRKKHADWHTVPLPDRMKSLPRDHRGFPIFAMAYRDPSGRAHFTVNDESIRTRMVEDDLCSICGKPLLRGRWFIGGEKSAFHPNGAYIDPPMHAECARYALKVCPYLASPSYEKLIHGATLPAEGAPLVIDQTAITSPSTADEVRPALFVAVHARGQRVKPALGGFVIKPTRPYIAVEYWQHGWRLDHDVGAAIVRQMGLSP
jgi:hypothetical protein